MFIGRFEHQPAARKLRAKIESGLLDGASTKQGRAPCATNVSSNTNQLKASIRRVDSSSTAGSEHETVITQQ
ncbi:hypothetical protein VTN31DRAFT_1724 [Thermomyces dupontii]|uniref:uncharacterized protein n=1 Tax=Talaromyces thermophilus TaxID=28565 RepID=UPI003743BA7B